MLCGYCHRPLAGDSKSCTYCGAGEEESATGGAQAGAAAVQGQPLNAGLYRLHTLFFYFLLFVAMGVLVGAVTLSRHGVLIGLVFGLLGDLVIVGIALLHRYAARGARLGTDHGRATSFAFACFWVLGFPIGTILAIYVFTQIFKSWEPGIKDGAPGVAPLPGD